MATDNEREQLEMIELNAESAGVKLTELYNKLAPLAFGENPQVGSRDRE